MLRSRAKRGVSKHERGALTFPWNTRREVRPDTLYINPMSDDDYLIRPDPLDPKLTERVSGVDQTGTRIETRVTVERALTIFLIRRRSSPR